MWFAARHLLKVATLQTTDLQKIFYFGKPAYHTLYSLVVIGRLWRR